MPVEALLLPLRMPLFCSFEIIALVGCGISAAAFFMALYTDRLLLPDSLRGDLDEIAGRARRLGIEYLKVSKSADLDEWIAQAVGRMAHRQEE